MELSDEEIYLRLLSTLYSITPQMYGAGLHTVAVCK